MRSPFPTASRCALVVALAGAALAAPPAGATKLRSVALLTPSATTADASGNAAASQPAVSDDGRYVVFTSTASDLTETTDANGVADVFWRDTRSGRTQLVSVVPAGSGSGNGASQHPDVSDDGRYVAFESAATNLVSGGAAGVYVRDMTTGTTALAGSGGAAPAISANGATIVFGQAGTLHAYDRAAGTTTDFSAPGLAGYALSRDGHRVAYTAGGVHWADLQTSAAVTVTSDSAVTDPPSLSADGRSVAYADGNAVFVQDVTAGTPAVAITAGDGPAHGAVLSADGRRVAFVSADSGVDDVYSRDLGSGVTTLVSASPDGAPQGGTSPSVSDDGRYVAFASDGTDLIAGLTEGNSATDVFVRDFAAAATPLLISTRAGALDAVDDGASTQPQISGDGRSIVFLSKAQNLVAPFHDADGTGDDLYQRGLKLDPAASFSDTAESGVAPLAVDFAASTPNPALAIDYAWDFGDGGGGRGATASHTYESAGTYTATLRIVDADGDVATAARTISVAAAPVAVVVPPPVPDVTPPKMTLSAARHMKLATVLKQGIRGGIGSDENCLAHLVATVPAAVAAKVGLGRHSVTIGTLNRPVAGRVSTAFRIRLTANARRHLAAHRKVAAITVTIAVAAVDTAGNAAKRIARAVTLVR